MDIYQKLEDENNLHVRRLRSTDAEDNFLTEEDERAIDQSDIIMTFLTKSKNFTWNFDSIWVSYLHFCSL